MGGRLLGHGRLIGIILYLYYLMGSPSDKFETVIFEIVSLQFYSFPANQNRICVNFVLIYPISMMGTGSFLGELVFYNLAHTSSTLSIPEEKVVKCVQ